MGVASCEKLGLILKLIPQIATSNAESKKKPERSWTCMMPNVVVKPGHEVDRLSLWKPDEPTVPGTCLWAHQLCDAGRVPSP